MPLPVHVPVLDAEHLALPAAGLQRADDAIVHRRAGPLVLLGVHCQRRVEQRLLLVGPDAAITFGFLLGSDRDAEAVERRVHQERRILEPPPVDRAPERTERAVHRGDRAPLTIRRLEALDRLGLLEHAHRLVAENGLHRFEPSLDGHRIAQAFRLDVVRAVAVEEVGNGQALRRPSAP